MSTDKRKTATDTVHVENDKQFLERSGASSQIKEVMTKILENRPADPVAFLADYFETVGEKSDKIHKAYQQISHTHYTKTAYTNNVKMAYEILGQNKVSTLLDRRAKAARQEPGRQVCGITGATYMDFLHLLCKEFHPTIRDKLFKKLRCREHEVVPFDIFKSAVFTCLVLKDFLNQADGLFQSLDPKKTGKVDRVLCDTITQQLHQAVCGTTPGNPVAVMEAGCKLGPSKVFTTLSTAFFKAGSDRTLTVLQEDFLVNVAETFLTKVHSLR